MIIKRLSELAARYEIRLDKEQLDLFSEYERLLLEWNQKMNLTAIVDHDQLLVKHFLDSILLVRYLSMADGASVIDVGTGAGFPGIPLKILRPDIHLTLFDSLRKRILFLETVCDELGFHTVQCVHGRAEEAGHKDEYREKYDVAVARAVAPMPVLLEYCVPFVRVGGSFVAMKGREVSKEITEKEEIMQKIGCGPINVSLYELPDHMERSICIVQKRSQLSTIYPRNQAKIKKNPLYIVE